MTSMGSPCSSKTAARLSRSSASAVFSRRLSFRPAPRELGWLSEEIEDRNFAGEQVEHGRSRAECNAIVTREPAAGARTSIFPEIHGRRRHGDEANGVPHGSDGVAQRRRGLRETPYEDAAARQPA